jgi:serine/threonine-protein kinase
VGTSRLATYDDAKIEVVLLSTGERRTILEGGAAAAYVESGHLAYRRGPSILAAPFDFARLAVTGESVAVIEGVRSYSVRGDPSFTVARTGMLVYVPDERSGQRLVLVDRVGAARPLTPFVEFLDAPRVSPDGRAIAVVRNAANDQVWRFDVEREAFSQVTFEWDNSSPVWTPDGESLIVSSTPGWRLHRVRADGSAPSQPLSVGGDQQFPGSLAPDGNSLAYQERGTNAGEDIWIAPLEPRGQPRAFLQTPARELWPAISPSGRLIAYMSDESGQFEVYLRSFPDGGNKIPVSFGGAGEPVWARSGKELFYSAPAGGAKQRMMVVDVNPGRPVGVSKSRVLFEHRYAAGFGYDVFPNGQHFVMIEADPEAVPLSHFNVVLNWFEELKRLVPPK